MEPDPPVARIFSPRGTLMPHLRPAFLTLAAVALIAAPASARADADWQKSYPLNAKGSLTFSTGDAATEVVSCGQCREIRIRIQWNDRHIADYTLNEVQTG